jgi:hypothetical protein
MSETAAVAALVLAATASVGGADALLSQADAPRHALAEGVIRVRTTVADERESSRTALDVYVREPAEVLCVFRDGPLAGRRILVVSDRVWLYVPGTRHPVRISPNQRLLGGASIADVARLRFADEFVVTSVGDDEVVDGLPCRTLALAGRSRRSAYASGTLWLARADGLPRRAVLVLPSGKPAKDLHFTDYAVENGKTVLRRLEVHHLLAAERGTTTTIELLSYEPRALAPELFDPQKARTVLLDEAPAIR